VDGILTLIMDVFLVFPPLEANLRLSICFSELRVMIIIIRICEVVNSNY
jgi:hypothetical protein